MRDPARIKPFLALFEELWNKHPDQRFGQLMMNLMRNEQGAFLDPWNWENEEWERRIADYDRIVGGLPTPDEFIADVLAAVTEGEEDERRDQAGG